MFGMVIDTGPFAFQYMFRMKVKVTDLLFLC